MIIFKKDNLFNYLNEVEAIVNTVNTVGVMGKGIALEFKNRYPDNFIAYKDKCMKKQIDIGNSYVHQIENINGNDMQAKYIINLPTKKHWRYPSKIEYIDKGLDNLIYITKEYNLKSIVLPALGCGNGNLDWQDVKPLIISKLEPLKDVKFIVIEPSQQKNNVTHKTKPRLTIERKMLLLLMDHYNKNTNGPLITHIEVNILNYFLNYTNLKMKFKLTPNGPYLDDLKKLLVILNPHYITPIENTDSNNGTEIKVLANKIPKKNDILSHSNFIKVKLLIDDFTTYEELLVLGVTHWFKFFEKIDGNNLLTAIKDWLANNNHQIDINIIIKSLNRIEKIYTKTDNLSFDLF